MSWTFPNNDTNWYSSGSRVWGLGFYLQCHVNWVCLTYTCNSRSWEVDNRVWNSRSYLATMGVWSQLELESLSKNKPQNKPNDYQMSCPEKISNHQHCATHTNIQQSSWVLGILRSLLQHKPATPQLSCSCVTASTHTVRAICHSLDCIVPHGCRHQCRPVSSCLAAQWLCEEGPHRGG